MNRGLLLGIAVWALGACTPKAEVPASALDVGSRNSITSGATNPGVPAIVLRLIPTACVSPNGSVPS